VAVETEVGRGSLFTVYLPRVEEADEGRVEVEPPSKTACGSETVLIVEDEQEVRRLAAEVLEAAGYQVLEAASGEEALAILDRHDGPLDLVIADVVMPGSSGWNVALSVRERRPETRVLFVSGYTEHPGIERALAQSEIALLAKPFTCDLLLETVRGVFESRTAPGRQPTA